jgi:RimJ/RimL family protein N-acetyltransferase
MSAAEIRVLVAGDEPAVERFLTAHPDTTLFLQSNLATAGLVDGGERYQGTWAAAFEEGAITALAMHAWQGNLLLEAPRHVGAVSRLAVATSGRGVAGLVGPYAQLVAARRALGLASVPAAMDSPDDLMAVSLDALRVPEPLARGSWTCRAPREEELEQASRWRHDYSVELLGAAPSDAVLAASRRDIAFYQSEGRNFVLEADGAVVAYAAYNAQTPRCVQIGGVFTPPPLRGRGYARAAVAGALLAARDRGVARSILFTGADNHAAQAAYRALGYERVGEYGLVLFSEPQAIR